CPPSRVEDKIYPRPWSQARITASPQRLRRRDARSPPAPTAAPRSAKAEETSMAEHFQPHAAHYAKANRQAHRSADKPGHKIPSPAKKMTIPGGNNRRARVGTQ